MMSILDQFRRMLGAQPDLPDPRARAVAEMPTSENLPRVGEVDAIFAQIVEQAIKAGTGYRVKLSGSDRYQQLKNEPDAMKLAVVEAAAEGTPRRGSRSYSGNSWQVQDVRKAIISQLLRSDLDVPVAMQGRLLQLWLQSGYSLEYSDVPGLPVISAVERHAEKSGLPDELRGILKKIHAKLTDIGTHRQNPTKWERGVIERIEALLDPASVADRPALPGGAFADQFIAWAEEQADAEKATWLDLAVHSAQAANKSAPSAKWSKEAAALVGTLGAGAYAEGLRNWLSSTVPDPAKLDDSLDILKGFLWAAPLAEGEDTAGAVGRFAETCFKKVRGVGARSVKLGNAALFALSEMAEQPRAGAELFRLKGLVKYPSAQKIIEKRLEELSDRSGQDIAAMEDASLPDFGLGADGTLVQDFGGATGTITLTSTDTQASWTNEAGKAVKSPPAAVRKDHKEAFTAFKQAAKDIEAARAAQAKRLEAGWLEQRDWAFADWQQHFLRHPLRRALVEALVWQVGSPDNGFAVLPEDGVLRSLDGKDINPTADMRISLWHPLQAQPADVLAWRERIIERGLVQPVKQAHREIYVLTDAERTTNTYSNRFAAHILRQHQFRALCQARGWQFEYLGGWDNWNQPTRALPQLNLRVEYAVEPVEDGQHSDAYVPLHLASDAVRFFEAGGREAMPLEHVDPVVFSEMMRDVDLFVAVTSVANDPGWQDGGPDGRFGTYWREWAFGELGQSAETRKQLIASIAPRLSIADRLEVGDKALIVTGKRQKYAIHFGSANIQILPANRYLCIVPDRTPAEADRIHLPFAGDNQLSTILAKAFLLVDEDKIKDPTILRQL